MCGAYARVTNDRDVTLGVFCDPATKKLGVAVQGRAFFDYGDIDKIQNVKWRTDKNTPDSVAFFAVSRGLITSNGMAAWLLADEIMKADDRFVIEGDKGGPEVFPVDGSKKALRKVLQACGLL